MNKKYELVKEDTIEYRGNTLYRIRALVNIYFSSAPMVRAGELGGYVSGEHNLDTEDSSWIYDDSVVMDCCKVFRNSCVRNNCILMGNVLVGGRSHINTFCIIKGAFNISDSYIKDSIISRCNDIVGENIEHSNILYSDINVLSIYLKHAEIRRSNIDLETLIVDNSSIAESKIEGVQAHMNNYSQIWDSIMLHVNHLLLWDKSAIYSSKNCLQNCTLSLVKSTVKGEVKLRKNDNRIAYKIEGCYLYAEAVIDKDMKCVTLSRDYDDYFAVYPSKGCREVTVAQLDGKYYYYVGCQHHIDGDKFRQRIENIDGGLASNPHRKEYLKLLDLLEK